ncbi:MAG: hypothetical protein M1816_001153 [Peltula sp. TS41687]|nr:MAG: hypothetical protein M1816_001153 [Peltula sp. TS41687]
MAGSTDFAQRWLTPACIQSIQDLWFRNLSPDDKVPGEDSIKRWFMRTDDIDRFCRDTYLPFLDDVQKSKPSPHDLLPGPFANPSTTLAIILLLDQIPRNVFRGPESQIVFNVFDPLAVDISLRSVFPKSYQRAMERISSTDATDAKSNQEPWYETEAAVLQDEDVNQGIDNLPQFRYHLGHRMWFYMPLMHSESLKVHGWVDKKYKAMVADVDGLSDVSNEVKEACAAMAKNLYKSGIDHSQLIERFGRYPHRNKPLGRESTPEEKEYLDKGGLTFGSDK